MPPESVRFSGQKKLPTFGVLRVPGLISDGFPEALNSWGDEQGRAGQGKGGAGKSVEILEEFFE
jgi:hypothetical protein